MKGKKKQSFRDWVRAYGIRRLARDLDLDVKTTSNWANGANRPGKTNLPKVLNLAKGLLTAEDVMLGGAR